MSTVVHIRFHGRGGEGVKLAGRIVSRAFFLRGSTVQDSPLYGAERRGAPVVSFVRIGQDRIDERGYITKPDITVVMDDSLLGSPDAAVLDGLPEHGLLLLNSDRTAESVREEFHIVSRLVVEDVSTLVLERLGQHLLSAPMAGFTLKTTGLVPWDLVAEAVRRELADLGLAANLIEKNVETTCVIYERAPSLGVPRTSDGVPAAVTEPFVLPHLSAREAAPSITAKGNTALRRVDGWRVYRPVIHTDRCTRCFLCFALCPEGAIHLDAEHFPVVDYEHCKGCLVCVEECPLRIIDAVREERV